MFRNLMLLLTLLSMLPAFAQKTLVYEAEEISGPAEAWGKDIKPVDKWNLWSTDKDAEKKWSGGGIVLQSPAVMEDREKPEDGAPVLHVVAKDLADATYLVTIKYGRGLAASLDGEKWINLSQTGGVVGRMTPKDGQIEFWIDDRFADKNSPGFTYYDTVTLTPQLPEDTGIQNGGFEIGNDMPGSGWGWFSRDQRGGAEFSPDAHSGKRAVKITYDGESDWALSNSGRLDVKPGDVWSASAWVKCEKTANLSFAVVALSGGQVMRWDIGSDGSFGTRDWEKLTATAYVPDGCDQIQVRFVGAGECLVWADDVKLEKGEQHISREPRPPVKGWAEERVEERLDRGMLALPMDGGKVYVGWRLLAHDPEGVAFNIYRATGRMRPVKLNETPLTKTTDFIDESPRLAFDNAYWVRAVVDGKELAPSGQAFLPPNAEPRSYVSIKLDGEHTFQKAGIADLDGDGRYDYVIKQPQDNIDPYRLYWTKSPDTYKIEAYLSDGTFLWRNDLGWSIERGIWYSPYLVWDLDGDGTAEVAVKTGEGDPRAEDGRVYEGPEYISIWDGMTGEERARDDWPSREGFGGGDAGYNYSSRNQLGIAYLDGKTPCLIVARGTYTTMKAVAYQFHGGKLEKLWSWDGREEGGLYRGQGAHFMHCADIDEDGRDEVLLGSAVIDDNGQALWSTGLGHPDHFYLGDIDPSRPGLEIYYGIETRNLRNSVCLVEAKTGKIIWGVDEPSKHVHATGLCADFDPLHPGMECYSGENEHPTKENPYRWLHAADGTLIANEKTVDMGLAPRAVHWDADPQRELLRGSRVSDFMGGTVAENIQGGQVVWADILGDWREEILTSVGGELRIYSSTIPATDRRVCLMQDPIYRKDVAHLAMGYAQVPTASYCIGGRHATLGIRPSAATIKSGDSIDATIVLVAPEGRGIGGTVKLEAGEGLTVEPASVDMSAEAGAVQEVTVKLTAQKRAGLFAGVAGLSVKASLPDADTPLDCDASIRLEDEPLTGVPIAQAEDFANETGGTVQIREDKIGAVGRSFSHWDAIGHKIQWVIDVPAAGEFWVAARYCTPQSVKREVSVDACEPFTQEFASTGGFSASQNDWLHGAIRNADGKPRRFKLAAGKHTVELTNTDGNGMNVDYIALVPVQ